MNRRKKTREHKFKKKNKTKNGEKDFVDVFVQKQNREKDEVWQTLLNQLKDSTPF